MAKKMQSMDGNQAAAHNAYAFTEVAGIFPITPSSPMAEFVDAWSVAGRKNIFDEVVSVSELQSEAGAAGTVHGSLQGGALTTTFTASQGLLLMIPNMYKIAGELLPGVFHVSARTLATQALSIFGDHMDVMACRATGFAMLASGSVQEVMDLAGLAHLAAIKSRVPFLHFFDGFRTSHEIQKVEVMDYEDLKDMVDWKAIQDFRDRALNPNHPVTRGTAENGDVYFQARESSNPFYDALPGIVVDYMKQISDITGREYHPFNYYGDPEAENIIVAMGSVTDTIEQVVDYLNKQGKKVGVVKVHLYRPFVNEYLKEAIPDTVKKITVLDRTKEPGANGEPLYLDVQSALFGEEDAPAVYGGRYGLSSKNTTPGMMLAVFENMDQPADKIKNHFTVGIDDDVTHLSLPYTEIDVEPKEITCCKFWGLGSDGTVGANKSAIKIIGDNTDLYAQGYFDYDSKKSGGITVSHLRFGSVPIKSPYLIVNSDFISCSTESYVYKYDLLKGLKKGGTFLLNTVWTPEQLDEVLPGHIKRYIANNDINFYIINATKIAEEIGLGRRTNTIMQSAFFKLADIIPIEEAVKFSKASIQKTYGNKGEDIVQMNYRAVDAGIDDSNLIKIDVPDSWKDAPDLEVEEKDVPRFIKQILEPVDRFEGDSVPVSAFNGIEDGTFPSGTSRYEKRGVAVNVPEWIPENCIQCNQCSFVCPHAAIRPFLLDEEEAKDKPDNFKTIKPVGKQLEGLEFRVQVDTLDCTGCGNCAATCPARNKALVMKPIHTQEDQIDNWEYAVDKVTVKDNLLNKYTLKGSQFCQPLLEFSGACAGCGETPYIKTITQLFGDRMMVANATGCSSIWAGSCPSTAYCHNVEGKGPAWANSLFEDNAEYGFGMLLATNKIRDTIESYLQQILEKGDPTDEFKAAAQEWIEVKEEGDASKEASKKLKEAIKDFDVNDKDLKEKLQFIKDNEDHYVKKSVWAFGGDGWAYDIGYGGLDQALSADKDINIFVLDTEVYSNTGGQASKATPVGAVAQFAAGGERIKKKDLGLMATTYGYVYVAQVCLGADKNQLIRVLKEAENYHGPSLIIGYAPCINHGIRGGMARTPQHQDEAVKCGYWHIWHFNPELAKEGKNPFVLDFNRPDFDKFQDFLNTEVRYTSLRKVEPEIADKLYQEAKKNAEARYQGYVELANKDF